MRGERAVSARYAALARCSSSFAALACTHVDRNLVAMDKPLRILIVLLLIEGENLALYIRDTLVNTILFLL